MNKIFSKFQFTYIISLSNKPTKFNQKDSTINMSFYKKHKSACYFISPTVTFFFFPNWTSWNVKVMKCYLQLLHIDMRDIWNLDKLPSGFELSHRCSSSETITLRESVWWTWEEAAHRHTEVDPSLLPVPSHRASWIKQQGKKLINRKGNASARQTGW